MANFIIEVTNRMERVHELYRASRSGLIDIPILVLKYPGPFTVCKDDFDSYRAYVIGYPKSLNLEDLRVLCFEANETNLKSAFVIEIDNLRFSDEEKEHMYNDLLIENLKGANWHKSDIDNFETMASKAPVFHYPKGTKFKDIMKITANIKKNSPIIFMSGTVSAKQEPVPKRIWFTAEGHSIFEY